MHVSSRTLIGFMRLVVGPAAIACALVWLAPDAHAAAPSAKTIALDASTLWVVGPDEPEALRRALRDVENDWYKVFGRLPAVVDRLPEKWTLPIICFGTKAPWLKELGATRYPGPESFVLRVVATASGGPAVLAAGVDARGAIYAAYALSEEWLGVDPWYFWVDKPPRYQGHVEVPAAYNKAWGPPTFKYRGWFINDEDLLARFAPDPLEEGIFSLEMWDRIYETLLRLRANTVIPGTFTFPDERMQVLASKRGLINSQHHICVVGLNTFQWPDEIPYSYLSHPDVLERMWRRCIDAMKDREVVWSVGLRGKHDRAFWRDDQQVTTPEARGKLISDAIAKQVAMVHKVQPQADCIANLWMEAVDLYKAGHLKLPKGVILVWPDDGAGRIRDAGEVVAGHGIYYHTAMLSGSQSQLTEIVNPARIHGELTRFVRAKATSYLVVNTSDVRPVPLSTNYVMKLAWDASGELSKSSAQAMHDYLVDWSAKQFSPEVANPVAALYADYFATPYMETGFGENRLIIEINKVLARVLTAAGAKKMPATGAEQLAKQYAQATEHLAALAPRAAALAARVPAERRDFYGAHVITQIEIHHRLSNVLQAFCKAVLALQQGDKPQAIARLDDALMEYQTMFAALRKAEYGRWQAWYAGEKFTFVFDTCVKLQRLRAQLAGEPQPPLRYNGSYPELYHYQQRAKPNYPLFYRGEK